MDGFDWIREHETTPDTDISMSFDDAVFYTTSRMKLCFRTKDITLFGNTSFQESAYQPYTNMEIGDLIIEKFFLSRNYGLNLPGVYIPPPEMENILNPVQLLRRVRVYRREVPFILEFKLKVLRRKHVTRDVYFNIPPKVWDSFSDSKKEKATTVQFYLSFNTLKRGLRIHNPKTEWDKYVKRPLFELPFEVVKILYNKDWLRLDPKHSNPFLK
jgi:hypothetical protein